MGRGPCAFKEADVVRAIEAARKANLEIAGFKVSKDGEITIVAGKPSDGMITATNKNDWDAIYEQNKN
jgi:hypothetical protein